VTKNKSLKKKRKKKESSSLNTDHVEYICSRLNVSTKRATEIYKLLGSDAVEAELRKHGGKNNNERTKT